MKKNDKIEELALEQISENSNEYEICYNCEYFGSFSEKEINILIPILGKNVKNCGVCLNFTGANDEPVIVNENTNQSDAIQNCGVRCFSWDEQRFKEVVYSLELFV